MSKVLRPLFFWVLVSVAPRPWTLVAQQTNTMPGSEAISRTDLSSTKAPETAAKIVLAAGTRLPLSLQNGINTRTAKAGDSVYFQTIYPIAQNNRIVIPMGAYARGEVTSVTRPGRLKGRAELRMAITSITFPNGYIVSLVAAPGSLDSDGKERVDSEGKIKGRSAVGKDAAIVGLSTLGGFTIGTQAGAVTAISSGSTRSFGTGAAVGSGGGLLAGLAIVALTRGPEAELRRGTMLDVVFERPLVLEAEHLPANDAGRVSTQVPSPTPAAEKPLKRQRNDFLWRLLRP